MFWFRRNNKPYAKVGGTFFHLVRHGKRTVRIRVRRKQTVRELRNFALYEVFRGTIKTSKVEPRRYISVHGVTPENPSFTRQMSLIPSEKLQNHYVIFPYPKGSGEKPWLTVSPKELWKLGAEILEFAYQTMLWEKNWRKENPEVVTDLEGESQSDGSEHED